MVVDDLLGPAVVTLDHVETEGQEILLLVVDGLAHECVRDAEVFHLGLVQFVLVVSGDGLAVARHQFGFGQVGFAECFGIYVADEFS